MTGEDFSECGRSDEEVQQDAVSGFCGRDRGQWSEYLQSKYRSGSPWCPLETLSAGMKCNTMDVLTRKQRKWNWMHVRRLARLENLYGRRRKWALLGIGPKSLSERMQIALNLHEGGSGIGVAVPAGVDDDCQLRTPGTCKRHVWSHVLYWKSM